VVTPGGNISSGAALGVWTDSSGTAGMRAYPAGPLGTEAAVPAVWAELTADRETSISELKKAVTSVDRIETFLGIGTLLQQCQLCEEGIPRMSLTRITPNAIFTICLRSEAGEWIIWSSFLTGR
jgi:hypothetical protein